MHGCGTARPYGYEDGGARPLAGYISISLIHTSNVLIGKCNLIQLQIIWSFRTVYAFIQSVNFEKHSVMFTRKIVLLHDFQFPYPYSFFSLDSEKIQSGM